jgi:hypothetical protein
VASGIPNTSGSRSQPHGRLGVSRRLGFSAVAHRRGWDRAPDSLVYWPDKKHRTMLIEKLSPTQTDEAFRTVGGDQAITGVSRRTWTTATRLFGAVEARASRLGSRSHTRRGR